MFSYKDALLSVCTEEGKERIFGGIIPVCPEDFFIKEETKCPENEIGIACGVCWDAPYNGETVHAKGSLRKCVLPDKNDKPIETL